MIFFTKFISESHVDILLKVLYPGTCFGGLVGDTGKYVHYHSRITFLLEMGLKMIGDFMVTSNLEQKLTKMYK